MSISAISELLLTQFGPKCKRRFLGQSLIDAKCQRDICQDNICPGDICQYQPYCYLPDFGQSLKVVFLGQSLTDSNFQGDICPSNICSSDICPSNICHGDICPYQEYLSYNCSNFDKHFWTQLFWGLNFCTPHLFGQSFLWPKYFLIPNFFGPKIFELKSFFTFNFVLLKKFWDLNS